MLRLLRLLHLLRLPHRLDLLVLRIVVVARRLHRTRRRAARDPGRSRRLARRLEVDPAHALAINRLESTLLPLGSLRSALGRLLRGLRVHRHLGSPLLLGSSRLGGDLCRGNVLGKVLGHELVNVEVLTVCHTRQDSHNLTTQDLVKHLGKGRGSHFDCWFLVVVS